MLLIALANLACKHTKAGFCSLRANFILIRTNVHVPFICSTALRPSI